MNVANGAAEPQPMHRSASTVDLSIRAAQRLLLRVRIILLWV